MDELNHTSFEINVVGRNIQTGDALPDHVESHLQNALAKYSPRPGTVDVTFSHEGHGYRCDCMVHLDTGAKLQSSSEAIDIYSSFNAAMARLEKQLRRYKRRLKDHHPKRNGGDEPEQSIASFVLNPAHEPSAEQADGSESEPLIIAETELRIESLSVGDAAMEMDLANEPVRIFRNGKDGGINIVYQRSDGNIGWIDLARLKE